MLGPTAKRAEIIGEPACRHEGSQAPAHRRGCLNAVAALAGKPEEALRLIHPHNRGLVLQDIELPEAKAVTGIGQVGASVGL